MNLSSKIVEVHRYKWWSYSIHLANSLRGSLLIVHSSKDKHTVGLNKSAYTLKTVMTIFSSLGLSS